MPFINSKVSVKVTKEQEMQLKERLGQAIAIIPGKSESWLMLDLEDEHKVLLSALSIASTIIAKPTLCGAVHSTGFCEKGTVKPKCPRFGVS